MPNQDELETFPQTEFINYSKTQEVLNDITLHLDEEIREPKYYRYIFDELESLTENCIVRIRVNTTGGSLTGAFAILEAIENTRATVYCHIVGDCHSAGSIIALSCPYISVGKNASMLIHAPSYGNSGKANDISKQSLHYTEQFVVLYNEVYKDFLSEAEIKEVLKGNDIWLNAEEITTRLENKFNPKKPRAKKPKAVSKEKPEKVKAVSKEQPEKTKAVTKAKPEVAVVA